MRGGAANTVGGERIRLDHIDGLRALAILWVAIYHYAAFWTPAGAGTDLIPYGAILAGTPLAQQGYLGVYLFFIVSGFVISMSLTRSATIGQFALNRMIRLWPTMIICGTLTFLVTWAFGPPELVRSLQEYLISLTFVPPPHIGRLIGEPDLEWLDGAYWSLWTEVRFYIVVAFLYFSVRSHFLWLWTAFAVVCTVLHLMALASGGTYDALSRLFFAIYQPYFTAGIALAYLRFGRVFWGPAALLAFAVCQAFAYPTLAAGGLSDRDLAGLIIVFVLAIPTMLSRDIVPVLSASWLVTLGVASYAYYLLHQNLGLSLLHRFAPDGTLGSIVAMLIIQVGLIGVSILLTQKIEVPLRRVLRRWTSHKATGERP